MSSSSSAKGSSPREVVGASLRYRIDPRDIAPSKAARLLGITLPEFNRLLPELLARGFPSADETTGNYDSVAIAAWQDARSGLAEPLTATPKPVNDPSIVSERLRRLNGQG